MRTFAFVCFVAVSVSFVGRTGAPRGCGAALAQYSAWKVADLWDLRVERADNSSYILHAIIGGVESFDGRPCWKLDFVPGNGIPPYLKNSRHRVVVDQKTGWPLRALRVSDKLTVALEKSGTASFVTAAPEGFPVEVFNVPDPGEKDNSQRITVRKQQLGSHFLLEMTVMNNGIEELAVRQVWVPGEKWWREYERYVRGRKDLAAKLLNPPKVQFIVASLSKLAKPKPAETTVALPDVQKPASDRVEEAGTEGKAPNQSGDGGSSRSFWLWAGALTVLAVGGLLVTLRIRRNHQPPARDLPRPRKQAR